MTGVRSMPKRENKAQKMVTFGIIIFIAMSSMPSFRVSAFPISITENDEIGIIKIIEINASNVSEVPDSWFVGSTWTPIVEPVNVSFEYNSSEESIDWIAGPVTYGGVGYIGALMPAMNTTLYFKMKIADAQWTKTFDIKCGVFWVRIMWKDTNIDVYSYYYNSVGALVTKMFNYVLPGDKIFEMYINYNADTQFTTTQIADKTMSTKFKNQNPCEHPFISPTVIYLQCESLSAGYTWRLNIYQFEQRMTRRYITPLGAPQKWQSFGIDGPHTTYTMEGMQHLADNGFNATLYWDSVNWGVLNATTKAFYMDLLNNKTFEMGLHTPQQLTTLPLDEALDTLDAEISYATENISIPLSYTAMTGAHNNSHTNYVWEKYGIFDRSNIGEVGLLPNAGNIHNSTWPWWAKAIENNTVHATFSHKLDQEYADIYSIDKSKFTLWVDTIRDNGGQIVPQAYWRGVINQNNYSSVSDILLTDDEYSFKLISNLSYPTYVDIYDIAGINSSTTVVVDENGFYTDFEFVPFTDSFRFLAKNNTSYRIMNTWIGELKYSLERTPGFSMNVSILMPSNWVNSTVQVYDYTTGTLIVWTEGSIEFNADARHEYIIQEVDPSFTYTTSGRNVVFTDTSAGYNLTYFWDFNDGTNSTSENPSHTYALYGTYTVSLTVTDEYGATNTTTEDITILSPAEQAQQSIETLTPVVIAATSVVLIVVILNRAIIAPFSRIFGRMRV